MFIDDELKRSFYLEMARLEHWDTRTLDQKVDGMLYERTALSRKPEEFIKQELLHQGSTVLYTTARQKDIKQKTTQSHSHCKRKSKFKANE